MNRFLRRPGLNRRAVALLAVSWLFAAPARQSAPAADAQSFEQLQAALLVTLARFVEWPPQAFGSASDPIVVAVVADEGVAEALDASARGKNVAGRSLVVRRLQWDSDLSGVHMLFLGTAEKRRFGVVIDRVQHRQIVTVSSLPEFGRAGGMIALTFTSGKISFAVNSGATDVSGVRLSSFLLSHATKVSEESGSRER